MVDDAGLSIPGLTRRDAGVWQTDVRTCGRVESALCTCIVR